MERKSFGTAVLELVQGDITRESADAIANAANATLAGGGGVDGAIHAAGGPEIMAECRRIGHCATGDAVITTAGRLPARYVIHTVGPVWQGGEHGEPDLLARCYRRVLQVADEHGVTSLALPSISTGVYGYPLHLAAPLAIETVTSCLVKICGVKRARFVLFGEAAYTAFCEALRQ